MKNLKIVFLRFFYIFFLLLQLAKNRLKFFYYITPLRNISFLTKTHEIVIVPHIDFYDVFKVLKKFFLLSENYYRIMGL